MKKVLTSPISKKKIIRDGYSMPVDDYALIAKIQASLSQQGIVATKSMILRAALHALIRLPSAERLKHFEDLSSIKTGRPPRDKS